MFWIVFLFIVIPERKIARSGCWLHFEAVYVCVKCFLCTLAICTPPRFPGIVMGFAGIAFKSFLYLSKSNLFRMANCRY